MLAEVAGLFILIGVTLGVGGALVGIASVLPRLFEPRPHSPRNLSRKDELAAAREKRLARRSECVESAASVEASRPEATGRQVVRFKRGALVFVALFAGVVLLVPWAAELRDQGSGGLVAAGALAVPLFIGLLYVRARGALDW